MSRDHITKVLQETPTIEKHINKMLKKKPTLILKALLNPEAKKPPKGPMMELNKLKDKECHTNGYIRMEVDLRPNCKKTFYFNIS